MSSPPKWAEDAYREYGRRWCDRATPVYMGYRWASDKTPSGGKVPGWEATRLTGHHHYSLCWHEQIPNALNALITATGGLKARSDDEAQQGLRHLIRHGAVYAFGVAQGHNLALLHDMLPDRQLFGFDSFAGLSDEDDRSSRISAWRAGMFKAQATPAQLVEGAGGPSRTRVIRGFFNNTLTPALARSEGIRPAAFVDIDCDLHASSFAALDWLFREKIARVGTLIGYDDWWTIPCHKSFREGAGGSGTKIVKSPLSVGEGLAHREVTQRYGLRFLCIAGPCRMPPTLDNKPCHQHKQWGPIFLVTAVGSTEPHHGFEMSSRDVAAWITRVETCRSVG